jgi:hypothetical protein
MPSSDTAVRKAKEKPYQLADKKACTFWATRLENISGLITASKGSARLGLSAYVRM